MNHDFIIAARRLQRSIDEINDTLLNSLQQMGIDYQKEIEQAILKNHETGRVYLISNIEELLDQLRFLNPKLRHKLLKLQNEGFDDYDASYSKTKDMVYLFDELLSSLLTLMIRYFPADKERYNEFKERYLKMDITQNSLEVDPSLQRYFEDSRSNLEIFLSKIILNPKSSSRFKTLEELTDSMLKHSNYEYEKYRNSLIDEISTFPSLKAQILEREMQQSSKDFNSIVDNNLIIDSVLKDPERFQVEFLNLAEILCHLDSEYLTGLCRTTIKRISLLHRIAFLKAYDETLFNSIDDNRSLVDSVSSNVPLLATVTQGLRPLSGSWNGNTKIKTDEFEKLVEDLVYLCEKGKLPTDRVQMIDLRFPVTFIRKTFQLLYSNLYPGRNADRRRLWINFIHLRFKQFANTAEDTTSRKFNEYGSDYDKDCERIKY
ncbi:hypothetical protein [Dyadobacter tibetensis]|uniref:hypothetical protein n=1 Tax=Dyadobacter tibetensis TaxID=1211851 RepID=UPI000471FDF4|nr:hypothetical protein [Dyadobacter tibetensis]